VEIETITTDLAHFDLSEEKWDGIVSIFAHVPPTIRKRLHQQVQDALRKEEVLILEALPIANPK